MRLFLRFLGFARPYRWRLVQSIVLMFVTLLLGMAMPWIMGDFIDNMRNISLLQDRWLGRYEPAPGEPAPERPAREELEAAQNTARNFLIIICCIMLGLGLMNATISVIHQLTMQYVGQRILFDMRARIYRHLQKLSLRYYETRQSGRIMARLLYDVEAIQSVLSGSIIEIVTSAATLIIALTLLFVLHWKLALIVFVVLPLYALNFTLVRRKISNASADVREKWSDLSGNVWERVSGVKIVKSFVREKHETLAEALQQLREEVLQPCIDISLGQWRRH